jgi:hypothetical protein
MLYLNRIYGIGPKIHSDFRADIVAGSKSKRGFRERFPVWVRPDEGIAVRLWPGLGEIAPAAADLIGLSSKSPIGVAYFFDDHLATFFHAW